MGHHLAKHEPKLKDGEMKTAVMAYLRHVWGDGSAPLNTSGPTVVFGAALLAKTIEHLQVTYNESKDIWHAIGS